MRPSKKHTVSSVLLDVRLTRTRLITAPLWHDQRRTSRSLLTATRALRLSSPGSSVSCEFTCPSELLIDFSFNLFSANEARCVGSLPAGSTCNTAMITAWVNEMAAYVKSLDPNHMVSVRPVVAGFLVYGSHCVIFYSSATRASSTGADAASTSTTVSSQQAQQDIFGVSAGSELTFSQTGGSGMDWDANLKLKNIDYGERTWSLIPFVLSCSDLTSASSLQELSTSCVLRWPLLPWLKR